MVHSCREREERFDPNWKTLEASIASLMPSLGFNISLKNSRGQLTKTKLTSYERRVVKFIAWKVAWKKRTCGHFTAAMTKFGW